MKRALLLSDSHGQNDAMMYVIRSNADVDAIFHMGDIVGADSLIEGSAKCLSYVVRGNCDRDYSLPESRLIDFSGKRIALTHGHRYVDYGGVDSLIYFGKENEADVVLFGHIHTPVCMKVGSMVICNPGSISRPRQYDGLRTYAIMEVHEDGEVNIRHYSYEDDINGKSIIRPYEIKNKNDTSDS